MATGWRTLASRRRTILPSASLAAWVARSAGEPHQDRGRGGARRPPLAIAGGGEAGPQRAGDGGLSEAVPGVGQQGGRLDASVGADHHLDDDGLLVDLLVVGLVRPGAGPVVVRQRDTAGPIAGTGGGRFAVGGRSPARAGPRAGPVG